MKDVIGLIFLLLFVLLFVPISISIKLHYNFFKNFGTLQIKFLNQFKMAQSHFYVKNGKLYLKNKKKETQLNLNLSDQKLIFYNELQKSILKKIMLKKFQVNFFIGIKDNPFLTSIISGQLQMALGVLFGYMDTKNEEGRTITSVHTNFKKEVFEFDFEGKIYVSIITIFLSIFDAYLKKIKIQGVKKQYGK